MPSALTFQWNAVFVTSVLSSAPQCVQAVVFSLSIGHFALVVETLECSCEVQSCLWYKFCGFIQLTVPRMVTRTTPKKKTNNTGYTYNYDKKKLLESDTKPPFPGNSFCIQSAIIQVQLCRCGVSLGLDFVSCTRSLCLRSQVATLKSM